MGGVRKTYTPEELMAQLEKRRERDRQSAHKRYTTNEDYRKSKRQSALAYYNRQKDELKRPKTAEDSA